MPRNLLVPVSKFLRLVDYMERIGLDAEAMVAALGMRRQAMLALPPEQRLPGRDYSRLYRNAVQQMQTLKRPIPWGAGLGSEAFELMCHSLISSKTLGEALATAQRFDKLVYPLIGYRMHANRSENIFELHYHVRTVVDGGGFAPENWDRSEHYKTVAHASGLLVWYGLSGWLIGRSIDLQEVHVAAPYVSDRYRDSLATVFQCPIYFAATENKLVASADYLQRRLVHTVASLREFLDNAVYELIALTSKPSSTSAAIRSLITLDFAEGIPSFEQMAANLHMSESSLRRRLLKEQTSYQQIKDQVRCELAVEYLRRRDTKINELAELLGFNEPSSFVRSFRSWMGVTPKAFRDGLQATA